MLAHGEAMEHLEKGEAMTTPKALSREVARTLIDRLRLAMMHETADALEAHIAALEANNAAFRERALTIAQWTPTVPRSCGETLEEVRCAIVLLVEESHPGGALLQAHRDALAAAERRHETTRATMHVREEEHRKTAEALEACQEHVRQTGEAHRKALEEAHVGTRHALRRLAEVLAGHGVTVSDQTRLTTIVDGLDALRVRARNEGLERAAHLAGKAGDATPAGQARDAIDRIRDRIRAMKEPESWG